MFFFLLVFKLDLICFNVIKSKKNTIRDGGTTAHAYTIDTVEMVYTVNMIYTVSHRRRDDEPFFYSGVDRS